ncbi:TetR/AcrR family transcriptional regulator [Paenisporosarcina sp. TG-14]|uniref:TetR/AcrR family transcriptional regulator n=1 Tax=Paenisporosarcina sp. TG-14 TaxID=1231057 RepID=UPI0003050336|nr:TetR/AcrR family transcriptional regulator [Paenisporosarcina sp. TG-14]
MKSIKDKTEQILQAAVKIFINKGLQATTQEISKEADVAEVTLFRKFSTKQNLFKTVIKNVLEKQFNSKVMQLADHENTEEFLKGTIDNRLKTLSKNASLVKMLISESLKGNLSSDIDFPVIIHAQLKKALDHHFTQKNQKADTELCARQLVGIFLSHIIIPNERPYYKLNDEDKEALVNKYVKSLITLL